MTVIPYSLHDVLKFSDEDGFITSTWPNFEDGTKLRVFITGPDAPKHPCDGNNVDWMDYILTVLKRFIAEIEEGKDIPRELPAGTHLMEEVSDNKVKIADPHNESNYNTRFEAMKMAIELDLGVQAADTIERFLLTREVPQ